MANLNLTAQPALNGAHFEYDGLTVHELTDFKILSLAVNQAQRSTAELNLQTAYGISWPEVGTSSSNGSVISMGLQNEQLFLFFQSANNHVLESDTELAKHGALTDQSDSWAVLSVTGKNVRPVLERICPINIADHAFQDGAVARTMMEHLSVIIMRVSDDFTLLSPRSSAQSFLHAVTQSADFVL